MKRKKWIRRKDGVRQRYTVGKKPKKTKHRKWTVDVDGGGVFRNPSKKYNVTRISLPAEEIIDTKRKPGQTREEWVEEIRKYNSDTYIDPAGKKTMKKDGTYNIKALKKAILSKDKKVPAVSIDKVDGKLKLWEGRHRVAAAHMAKERVPAVILEKKSDKQIEQEFEQDMKKRFGSIFWTGKSKKKKPKYNYGFDNRPRLKDLKKYEEKNRRGEIDDFGEFFEKHRKMIKKRRKDRKV